MGVLCEAKGCSARGEHDVKVKRGDTLRVCDLHERLLRDAGEVVEVLPTHDEAIEQRRAKRETAQKCAWPECSTKPTGGRQACKKHEYQIGVLRKLHGLVATTQMDAAVRARLPALWAERESHPKYADALPTGRPKMIVAETTIETARSLRAEGKSITEVAKAVGLDKNTLARRLDEPEARSMVPLQGSPLEEAAAMLTKAAGLRKTAMLRRREADNLDAEAVEVVAKARALLERA